MIQYISINNFLRMQCTKADVNLVALRLMDEDKHVVHLTLESLIGGVVVRIGRS